MYAQYGLNSVAHESLWRPSSLGEYLHPITKAFMQELSAPYAGAGIFFDQVWAGGGDLRLGLPTPGPFALVHARLVLGRLPNRRQLLRQIVDALITGGWLVIGEFRFDRPPALISAASADMESLFKKVVDDITDLLFKECAIDSGWICQMPAMMAAAGLQRVKSREYSPIWTGGDPGCQLLLGFVRHMRDPLVEGGLTTNDLRHVEQMLLNGEFSCSPWPFTYARGQKPAASPTIWVP